MARQAALFQAVGEREDDATAHAQTFPDRTKRTAAIAKATVEVESAMLATTTPDHLIEQAKEHMVFLLKLAPGKRKRSAR